MPDRYPDHVLVVDDDHALRNYIGTHLQRQRYRVSSAADGRSALRLIDQDCPDVVILDHYLPDMTGEELLDTLRKGEHTRPLPVIFLSVDGSHTRFRSSMDRGADDFLVKPVQPRELSDAVAAQLRKSRLRPAAAPPRRAATVAGVPPAYRVKGTLAQGGSATAYIARNDAQSVDCVVKVIPLADNLDAEIVARFSREGGLLERLSHPNIVRIYEHGVQDGHAFLAMEYVAGGTLKQLLGAPWEVPQALGLVLKLARGLSAVHAAGVVHRDLKPDNVLLRAESLDPVLLDFGAARDLHNDHQITAAGTILGTPSYMAPEIIEGAHAVPASDVYACGVMLYELITGAKPYVADNATALMYQHVKFPIPLLPRRHAAAQSLLAALLAKNPRDRPMDGAALAGLLAQYLRKLAH